MARTIQSSPGRPLADFDTTPPDFTFTITGSCPVRGDDNGEMNDYRRLYQIITEKFAARLTIVKFDDNGRRLHKQRAPLPSAGTPALAHWVGAHQGQDIYFYARALFGKRTRSNPSAKLDESLMKVAVSRTRTLITLAMKDFLIERRYDVSGISVYFPIGSHLARGYARTKAEAHVRRSKEQFAAAKDPDEFVP